MIKAIANQIHEDTDGDYDGRFNCYNAVLYCLGLTEHYEWTCEVDMARTLDTFNEVTEPRIGTVVALYSSWGLIHVAICLGDDRWFHKRGAADSRFSTFSEILDDYNQCTSHKFLEMP